MTETESSTAPAPRRARIVWLAAGASAIAVLLFLARRVPVDRDALWILLCTVAVLAFAILLVEALGGIRSDRMRRLWDVALILLATTTVWAWLAVHGLDTGRLLHVWDAFHYYVGGKYFEELRYERLYECTLIADSETRGRGRGRLGRDVIRDLRTNELVRAAEVLATPDRCKSHFTPERWEAFGNDVAFFRARLPEARWRQLRTDHGYNPPPSWLLLGGTLAGLAPASRTHLAFLTLVDPVLLAGMFACIGWAFGWRVTLVALVYFGTNWHASFTWVGGGVLRYGWLVAAVVGICLLRRNHMALAGGLLAFSASLRVFPLSIPAFVALGIALGWLRDRHISLSPPQWRLLAGGLGGVVLVGVLATPLAGGPEVWGEFVSNSRLHLDTPLNNHMGLPAVFAYDHEHREARTVQPGAPDPHEAWRRHRRVAFTSHAVPFWLLSLVLGALLVAAVRGQPAWIAAIVGTAAIPVFFEVTCYYHAVLVALVLLWPRWKLAGLAMIGLACVSLALGRVPMGRDQYFFWMNLATLVVVVLVMGGLVLARPRAEEPAPS